MHPRLDPGRLETRLGSYATGPAAALTDAALLARVQEYRRQLGARMVALDRADIGRRLPAGGAAGGGGGGSACIVSRKIDGEFTVLVHDEGHEAFIMNPGGTVRTGLAFLAEASSLLGKAGVRSALLAGELHFVRPDGRRSRVHDVCRAARQPDSQADLDALRLAVFDVIEIDAKPPGATTTSGMFDLIGRLIGHGKAITPVETLGARNAADVEKAYRKWVEDEGGEGIVVRSDTAGWFKIKPSHTLDVVVVGFTEGTADRKGLLHDMLVAVMRADGTFHVLGRVGGGFTEDQRRDFLSDLKDMVTGSDYAEVGADHVAYQMVRPEWVVEMQCLDLVSQTTRGGPIDRMTLEWDATACRWKPIRRLPLASVISPQFVRRRDDKSVCPADVRIQQVSDLVEVAHADRDARQLVLPASEVLQRGVWTKVFRGQRMVRKLLMWQTNKQQEPGFPAYVVHFTDFSPGRKTPLEREIRVSRSREQILALYDALREEHIVKGWEKQG
jgi:hypothetical protein